MAHPEQAVWCKHVRAINADKFNNPDVLDIGSLDINGNNRYLFNGGTYIGVDVGEGKNVDVVCKGHEFRSDKLFDIVISTECFEHDPHWRETILNCIRLTKSGGIFMFTCATTGRQEHGTRRTTPQDSPLTLEMFNDYYMNLEEKHIRSVFSPEEVFLEFKFATNNHTKDLYFYGVKK